LFLSRPALSSAFLFQNAPLLRRSGAQHRARSSTTGAKVEKELLALIWKKKKKLFPVTAFIVKRDG
jgi:hypothetical protein